MDLTKITSTSFLDLLKLKNFKIPDFQRAYSWEFKQIKLFIDDLIEYERNNQNGVIDKRYYLGHFILEKSNENNEFEIVDGQQRLTTIILFMIVCKHLTKNHSILDEINFKPVSYDVKGYNIILESDLNKLSFDYNGFNDTSSLLRMKEAILIFLNSFTGSEKQILLENKIDNYIKIIENAYCSFVIFSDKAVSSQIFELHNTRGLPLTETEKVKSTLMKMVYMHSIKENINDNINIIENAFSNIFQNEEKAKNIWFRGELSLDSILMYHLRAIEDGHKKENFSKPNNISGENGSFEYIREKISKLDKEEILKYCINIANEFNKSMYIISELIPKLDQEIPSIGDSIILDKNRSLIFLLKILRNDINTINKIIFKRWEHFLFCNDLIDWSGFFYRKLYREKFEEIYKSLNDVSKANKLILDYYYARESFASGWDKSVFEILTENIIDREISKNAIKKEIYNNSKLNVAYLLYKFEINNESVDFKEIRMNIFKNNSVSIDHIVAQSLSWNDFGYSDEGYKNKKDEAEKDWKEVLDVIHGIGNLSLTTSNSNSSDSNKPPTKHIETYNKMGLNHTSNQVSNWTNPKHFTQNIINRGDEILNFIITEFINENEIWKEI